MLLHLFEHYSVSSMRYHNMIFLQLSWMFIASVVCSSAQLDQDQFGRSDTLHAVDHAGVPPVSINCYSSLTCLSLVLQIVHFLLHHVIVCYVVLAF